MRFEIGASSNFIFHGFHIEKLQCMELISRANKLNSSWVELHKSRGMETESHKVFMRITVLATYWIVYISFLLLSIDFHSEVGSDKMVRFFLYEVRFLKL